MVDLLKILIPLIFSTVFLAQQQNYKVEYLTPQNELAHGCIQSIIQDSDGFMWFATEGGLNRYDGYEMKLFPLPDNFIHSIVEDTIDEEKYLWVCTKNGGLIKFNRENETFIQYVKDPLDSTSISSNHIKCIFKDRSGIYWIGSIGTGLIRFDQITGKFISFRNNPNDRNSISSNAVYSICEDYLGNLWVGTYKGGLDLFDRKASKFIHFKYDPNNPQSLPSNEIYVLLEDRNRTLWISTSWGLFKYDRENKRFIRHEIEDIDTKILNYGLFYSLTLDCENTLWIPHQARGVISIPSDRKSYKLYRYNQNNKDLLITSLVSSVWRDRSGIIWVGTFCKGINKIIPTKKQFESHQHVPGDSTSLTDERVYSLYEDEDSILWIGTGEGLAKFDNNKFIKHPFFDDWFYENIVKIVESKTGKLWLARGRSLTEYDPKTEKYNNYFSKHLIYSPSVFEMVKKVVSDSAIICSIEQVTNNQNLIKEFEIKKLTHGLVLSTGEGNLSELVDYGWITNEDSNEVIWEMINEDTRFAGGGFNNRVQISVLKLKPGKYRLNYHSNDSHAYGNWVIRAPIPNDIYGISIYQITESEFQKYQNSIAAKYFQKLNWNDLYHIVEDNEGRVWCTLSELENTVYYFDKASEQFLPFPINVNGTTYKFISKIIKDSMNQLWFITITNVLIVKDKDGNCEIKFDLRNSLPDSSVYIKYNAINHVYEDSKNNFWIGTDFGLFKYNLRTENVEHFKNKEFTSPNKIQGIIEDNEGILWISTEFQILKFDSKNNTVRSFDYSDGIPDVLFGPGCCLRRKNGQIVFGGGNGIVSFSPDKIIENNVIPVIKFTDFQIYNSSVIPGPNSPLKKTIHETEEIVLTHDQDNISFKFAALDFTSPSQNKYAVMMEGIDTSWIYQDDSRRYARYTKMDPGEYVFRVKGSNNDGIWNEVGASILITILPPWWATWWFRAIMLFCFAALIYGIYKYRVKRILEIERMRIQIASDLHDDVGSSLTKITVHSEIIKNTDDLIKINNSSAKIGNMSREIITSFSDIIWSIDARNDKVGDLIDRMRDYLDQVFPAGTVSTDFQTQGLKFENNIDQTLRQNIYLIFKEAVNNAAKHSGASEMKIHMTNGSGKFRLEIIDNGRGIDLNGKSKGYHGIENMKLRAERISGELKIESENNTKIILIVKEL